MTGHQLADRIEGGTRERCQAITNKSTQCTRPARPDGRFCPVHERQING